MLVWTGHKARLRSMAFSPDGRMLATTAGDSKFAWLWDATSGNLVKKLSVNENAARQAVFFPDGRHLAVLHEQRTIGVFDLVSWETIAVLITDSFQYVDPIAISPDGARLLTCRPGAFNEWTEPTRPAHTPRMPDREHAVGGGGYPTRLAFSPLGSRVCLASQSLQLHDPATLARKRSLHDPKGAAVAAFAFTADESRLVVAFGYRAYVIENWLSDKKETRVPLRGHEALVRAVGFLPGGETVLTAGMDGTARLWDTATGVEKRSFDWGIGQVLVAAVSPDGTLCAAGSKTGRIVVWDVDT
jgi:WD40 repeat protein